VLLNRLEFVLMNNPVRAAVQRHVEGPQLLRMGGALNGGVALELGCGRGVGAELILGRFGAAHVDGFDLDPRMVRRARRRLRRYGGRARFWVGDATAIPVPDGAYDAVFDFGTIHHVPAWRQVVTEVRRVLAPGGRFYAEEILAPAIRRSRLFFAHPQTGRFDAEQFEAALAQAGLTSVARASVGRSFAWFVATKPDSIWT
jgi:ubiquinone/menaquinone biosynthesis C-methylase UbiE